MVTYEAHHGALGRIISEDTIDYNGQSITVFDRIRVTATCEECNTRWVPSTPDEARTCPNEDAHDPGAASDTQRAMLTSEVVSDADNGAAEEATPYQVSLDEHYVEEYHFPEGGRTVAVSYQTVIRCEHCDYEWGTTSMADRPSCSRCHRKTDRETLGKHYETYLKYALFNGHEESISEVSQTLRSRAEQFELMEANGWRFDCTTQSSHVAMSKGDAPQQDIVA